MTPSVVRGSAGAVAMGAITGGSIFTSSGFGGSIGFSTGAGGGSSRAGSGLLREWLPSRSALGGASFCLRPPPPPPPPGPGKARYTSRTGSCDTTSSTGCSARSEKPRLASAASVSAARPWRPVESSTGRPAGLDEAGAMASTERDSAPTVAPAARARTAVDRLGGRHQRAHRRTGHLGRASPGSHGPPDRARRRRTRRRPRRSRRAKTGRCRWARAWRHLPPSQKPCRFWHVPAPSGGRMNQARFPGVFAPPSRRARARRLAPARLMRRGDTRVLTRTPCSVPYTSGHEHPGRVCRQGGGGDGSQFGHRPGDRPGAVARGRVGGAREPRCRSPGRRGGRGRRARRTRWPPTSPPTTRPRA